MIHLKCPIIANNNLCICESPNSEYIFKGYKMDFRAKWMQFQLLSATVEQQLFVAANNTETVISRQLINNRHISNSTNFVSNNTVHT